MLAVVVTLVAALNPAAASVALVSDRRRDRPVALLAGGVIAWSVLVAAAAGGSSLLDALDTELGTFRLGAGLVVTLTGLRWVLVGPAATTEEPASDRALAGFVAFPALLTPGALTTALAAGAADDHAAAVVGAALACALGVAGLWVRRSLPTGLVLALVRLLGAVAVVAGVILAIDGVDTL